MKKSPKVFLRTTDKKKNNKGEHNMKTVNVAMFDVIDSLVSGGLAKGEAARAVRLMVSVGKGRRPSTQSSDGQLLHTSACIAANWGIGLNRKFSFALGEIEPFFYDRD